MFHPHDPLARQHASRAAHRENQVARQKLQTLARQLSADVARLFATIEQGDGHAASVAAHREALNEMRGRLTMYVQVREMLSPGVATDRYTQELNGKCKRIAQWLKTDDDNG